MSYSRRNEMVRIEESDDELTMMLRDARVRE